jgi:hypothetical protein
MKPSSSTAISHPNIAFIKFTLAKLGRTNGKGDSGAKDFSTPTPYHVVSPIYCQTTRIHQSNRG